MDSEKGPYLQSSIPSSNVSYIQIAGTDLAFMMALSIAYHQDGSMYGVHICAPDTKCLGFPVGRWPSECGLVKTILPEIYTAVDIVRFWEYSNMCILPQCTGADRSCIDARETVYPRRITRGNFPQARHQRSRILWEKMCCLGSILHSGIFAMRIRRQMSYHYRVATKKGAAMPQKIVQPNFLSSTPSRVSSFTVPS